MTFQEHIRSSNSLHNQLISTISITSNASHEVRETSHYILELQYQIKIATKNANALRLRVEKLRAGYEGLRDGSTKRLFSKVSGKTDELLAKTTKAELDYQEAFEEQAKAITHLENLRKNLEEAQRSLPHLKDQVAIHKATQSELDDLYSSIFSLPHADYPEEIAANQEIGAIQTSISDLENQINIESQALKLLSNARKCLIWSQAAVQNAQEADHNKGSPFNEHHLAGLSVVRNAMSTAQLHAMQAELAYNSAQKIQPSIQNMQQLEILEETFLIGTSYKPGWNLLLDATELTSKIGRCTAEIKPAIDDVGKEIGITKERINSLEDEKEELEGEAVDILRRARREVIEFVMGQRSASTADEEDATEEDIEAAVGPPGYSP